MSNLIKSTHVVSLEDLKKLELQRVHLHQGYQQVAAASEPAEPQPDKDTIALREQILRDAESFAEERIQQAAAEADELLRQAQAQIEEWWNSQRAADAQQAEEARRAGFEQGAREGYASAEAELQRLWATPIDEAKQLLQEAHAVREQIIQEAEPFLVELSNAIAEKVIAKQLELEPAYTIELIRRALSRRREQGVIALCVAPSQFAFVQAAREELVLALDSQAELQILPDATVADNGCVIRSAFGSIDARIDTQLEEIKRELLEVALHGERDASETSNP